MFLSPKKQGRWRFLIPVVLALLFLALIPQTQRRAPWYQQLAANLISPIQWVFTSVSNGIDSIWEGYISLVGAKEENESLKVENAKLSSAVIKMEEIQQENERLRSLLGYGESFTYPYVAAQVISNDPRAEFKSLIINRGKKHGIKLLMPVVGPKGLVGRIGRVSRDSALVLLLNDPNCAVDVMIQRSRTRGLLVGSITHAEMSKNYYLTRIEYLQRLSDIENGDLVVSSGLDQIFPPGIPVGTVLNIENSRQGLFREAEVVPFENFQELQEVMVMLTDHSQQS